MPIVPQNETLENWIPKRWQKWGKILALCPDQVFWLMMILTKYYVVRRWWNLSSSETEIATRTDPCLRGSKMSEGEQMRSCKRQTIRKWSIFSQSPSGWTFRLCMFLESNNYLHRITGTFVMHNTQFVFFRKCSRMYVCGFIQNISHVNHVKKLANERASKFLTSMQYHFFGFWGICCNTRNALIRYYTKCSDMLEN